VPRADTYISSLIPPGSNRAAVRSKVLTQFEALSLTEGLRADASDFYYSAWVSFLDALGGINTSFYTWAKVKLYYSAFYAFRASLAIDDVCAFHFGGAPFTIVAKAGEAPISVTDRGTHKTVLRTFQRRAPNHPLFSQQIDLTDALDWLVNMRESAHYGQARFCDPECGAEFEQVVELGLRRALNAYIADAAFSYVFDPDHAAVAYPLRVLQMVGTQMLGVGVASPSATAQKFLKSRARDRAGTISSITGELKRLRLVG
jgi:hypothetical protein